MIPTGTYRLQLHHEFTFNDARAIVPYLDALGVSHAYCSPYLRARPGSLHGYDIVDHGQLNPEIGTPAEFEAFCAELRRRGMGQVADFVPNHMGVGGDENAWWLDVLEWGPDSPFATFFDIDWNPIRRNLQNKVLVPFLGDQYGTILGNGELQVRYDDEQGRFDARYYEHRFPLKPSSYATILRHTGETILVALAAEFAALGRSNRSSAARAAARRRADELRAQLRETLRDERRWERLHAVLRETNGEPGKPASFARLDALLSTQHYRVAYWKVAAEEINYRRFFDINGLAALQMSNPETFGLAHRLVFELIANGNVDGLRIDHVDGLLNPEGYCQLVRARAEMLGTPLYLVVEKILAYGEHVPLDWGVDGTTGYEFASDVVGLFVRSSNERIFSRLYTRFSDVFNAYDDIVYECKRLITDIALASELNVLATNLDRIAQTDPASRDFTLYGLRSAIKEIVACFPVYRTYVTSETVDPADRHYIESAVDEACRRNPLADHSTFLFVRDVLTCDVLRRRGAHYDRNAVVRFAMRFQQFSAPVMAKGVEDTAFYRYNRLIALNEVGGDPKRFGTAVAAFHRANRLRATAFPSTMVTTATHDTKRGEDARARIAVLSEMPREWTEAVLRWRRYNEPLRDGGVPGGNEEYLLYQVLVGSWPVEFVGREPSGDELADLRERIGAYVVKAVREAKAYSSWASPNTEYEDSFVAFVDAILDPQRGAFVHDFSSFMTRVAPVGAWNGLAQTVLKLAGPGVPDTYQGTELWDYSLVDPDNRRPVDYALRSRLLDELANASDPHALVRDLVDGWNDGRIKLYVTWKLLTHRRGLEAGEYIPLFGAGTYAAHVVAFAFGNAIAVVPRLSSTLLGKREGAPVGSALWGTTSLRVQGRLRGRYRNIFTGAEHRIGDGARMSRVPIAEILADFPVAVLVRT